MAEVKQETAQQINRKDRDKWIEAEKGIDYPEATGISYRNGVQYVYVPSEPGKAAPKPPWEVVAPVSPTDAKKR